jgi:hypothetical protein
MCTRRSRSSWTIEFIWRRFTRGELLNIAAVVRELESMRQSIWDAIESRWQSVYNGARSYYDLLAWRSLYTLGIVFTMVALS